VLRTLAFESFDFSSYDLVLSSSSAEAKGIITPTETLHISYIHTPVRYYWSNYDQYIADPGFGALNSFVRLVAPYFVRRMRRWDYAAAQRPDALIANSATVAKRIKKYYKRESKVIHPPVDLARFQLGNATNGDYYLIVSRLVPYKRYDIAVEACNKLGKRLVIAGNGSELGRLKKLAGPTIEFRGSLPEDDITRLYEGCRAFLFPAEEDFGITPLEAMACGKPVLAYGKGGATETVVDGKTGLLFSAQTAESLADAISRSEAVEWDAQAIARHATMFSEERFIKQIHEAVTAKQA
jgi:glycosyltransferase involved in cell wall biosynthesis